MNRILFVAVSISLILFSVLIVGLWYFIEAQNIETLKLWAFWATLAALAFLALFPFLLYSGFYFGKTEARGILQGVDKAMERGYAMMQATVQVRDQSRIKVNNAIGTRGTEAVNGPVLVYPKLEDFSESGRNHEDIIDM